MTPHLLQHQAIWPMESMNPKQLRETQVTKMSMFDNGVTQSLIDGTYQ